MGFGGFRPGERPGTQKRTSPRLAWSPFMTTKVCVAMNYSFSVSSGLSQTWSAPMASGPDARGRYSDCLSESDHLVVLRHDDP
jgi:hypothetical protein